MSYIRKTGDCRGCGKRTRMFILLPEAADFVPLCREHFERETGAILRTAGEQLRARLRLSQGPVEECAEAIQQSRLRRIGPGMVVLYERVFLVDDPDYRVSWALTLVNAAVAGRPTCNPGAGGGRVRDAWGEAWLSTSHEADAYSGRPPTT